MSEMVAEERWLLIEGRDGGRVLNLDNTIQEFKFQDLTPLSSPLSSLDKF